MTQTPHRSYRLATPALNPAAPGITADGLTHIRGDALNRACAADAQGRAASAKGDYILAAYCDGEARALRQVVRQLTAYSLGDHWRVDPPEVPLPITVPVTEGSR